MDFAQALEHLMCVNSDCVLVASVAGPGSCTVLTEHAKGQGMFHFDNPTHFMTSP